jgi:hypothetical protein
MVAVVNGYVCFTTCDAEKAKQDKDPNAPPGALPGEDSKHKKELDAQPVTVLDGALKDLAKALDPTSRSDPSNPVLGRSPPGDTTSSSRIDVLA